MCVKTAYYFIQLCFSPHKIGLYELWLQAACVMCIEPTECISDNAQYDLCFPNKQKAILGVSILRLRKLIAKSKHVNGGLSQFYYSLVIFMAKFNFVSFRLIFIGNSYNLFPSGIHAINTCNFVVLLNIIL